MSELETLQSWIDQSHNIVFFGGAGVSTESGIKDFRSPDGLYNQHYKFPPETMLSRSFFDAHREEFFRFYRDKMLNPGPSPTPPTRSWLSWRRRESCAASSPRTSTASIRRPGPSGCGSSTARCCATGA